jgi:hypothetical protein
MAGCPQNEERAIKLVVVSLGLAMKTGSILFVFQSRFYPRLAILHAG